MIPKPLLNVASEKSYNHFFATGTIVSRSLGAGRVESKTVKGRKSKVKGGISPADAEESDAEGQSPNGEPNGLSACDTASCLALTHSGGGDCEFSELQGNEMANLGQDPLMIGIGSLIKDKSDQKME